MLLDVIYYLLGMGITMSPPSREVGFLTYIMLLLGGNVFLLWVIKLMVSLIGAWIAFGRNWYWPFTSFWSYLWVRKSYLELGPLRSIVIQSQRSVCWRGWLMGGWCLSFGFTMKVILFCLRNEVGC